jgi:carbonic anhydrase
MRNIFQLTAKVVLISLLSFAVASASDHAKSKHADINVLQTLLDGNKRFVDEELLHPHLDQKTIKENAKGQNPYAVIIACSDSRVPVEAIFDAGVGDIFIIRTAGNVLGSYELGSIQYAVEHLGVKFVGVLGHSGCGAVKAYANGDHAEGNLKDIVLHISQQEEQQAIPDPKIDHFEQCVFANIFHGVKQIVDDPQIKNVSANNGRVLVLPMLYHTDTGVVEVLDISKQH